MDLGLSTQEQNEIAQRLEVDYQIINSLKRLSRKLSRISEEHCNGDQLYKFKGNWEKWEKWIDSETDRLEAKASELARSTDLHIYFQGDPRGAAIYVSREPIEEDNYTANSIAIY